MHASIILSAVLIFCINGGLGRAINANEKVNFTLYYESLCPDCRQFMTTELHRAYQSVLDIANISIVPYGNAHETYDPTTQLYQFTCQHGAAECLGNLIHVK
jgi:interferon gamma-inducible protein 30